MLNDALYKDNKFNRMQTVRTLDSSELQSVMKVQWTLGTCGITICAKTLKRSE